MFFIMFKGANIFVPELFYIFNTTSSNVKCSINYYTIFLTEKKTNTAKFLLLRCFIVPLV